MEAYTPYSGQDVPAPVFDFYDIQLAMDGAIADLGLSAVDVRSNCKDCGSTGGSSLTERTSPADF